MSEDRTLFGDGRYPDAGPLAILARLGFLSAGLAIVVAVFMPAELVPDIVHSHYLQHFAAFYVAILLGMAAMPRARLRGIVLGYGIFATVLESSHLLSGAALAALIDNWVADLGGIAAAVAPVVVERFRRRFPRTPKPGG
jgi:hypothetical protein